MTGSFNFQKFAIFLKSFWGILASFVVILPTIIYLLKTGNVNTSVISGYYVSIPTTFSLLVIPFVFLFEDVLSQLKKARKAAVVFSFGALITLFAFLVTKKVMVTDKTYSVYETGYLSTDVSENAAGAVEMTVVNYALPQHPQTVRRELGINIWEIVSLSLYSISIIMLTAAFAIVGVFFYSRQPQAAGP